MKNGSTFRNSVEFYSYYTARTGSTYAVIRSANGEQDDVSHGPIIKGNFVTPNSWSFDIQHRWHEQGHSQVVYTNGDIETSDGGNSVGQLPARPSADTTKVYNEALSRAYGKIYGDMNIAVDVAEWRQTRDMLNATRQAEAFMAKRIPLLRKAGSLWLQYVYGWRPLAQTVWSAAYEMQNRMIDRVTVATGRASDTQAINSTSSSTYERIILKGQVKTRALVKVRYQEDGIPPISRWMSLNPASIAWELTPYSFVVDWFYNIGGYMQDFERALLLNRSFRDGFVSLSSLSDVQRIRQSTGFTSPDQKSVLYEYTSRGQWKSMSRTKLSAPPLPRPPVLNTHLGSGRLLNAASLLSQFLGRR